MPKINKVESPQGNHNQDSISPLLNNQHEYTNTSHHLTATTSTHPEATVHIVGTWPLLNDTCTSHYLTATAATQPEAAIPHRYLTHDKDTSLRRHKATIHDGFTCPCEFCLIIQSLK